MIGRRKMMTESKIAELIRKYDIKLMEPKILIGRTMTDIQRDHSLTVENLLREISDDLAALYEEEINGTKET